MYYLIVSDLHLGAGDLLEDFLVWGDNPSGPPEAERPRAMAALGQRFADFLEDQHRRAEELELPAHLILLGDIFDLWQVQSPREKPAAALLRILGAHPPVVAALRAWLARAGALSLILGNHDQPLVAPEAWAVLREVFPGLNRTTGGDPIHAFSCPEAGLYAEHGHQWDPFNRMRSLSKPNADCAGRRIVRHVVNRLEPMMPLIDKGADMRDLMEELWRAGEGEGLPVWREVAGHLARLIGRAAGPARILHEEIQRWIGNPRQEKPDFDAVARGILRLEEHALRRAIHPRPGGTLGTPPPNLRFIVSGHTHRPLRSEVPVAGRNIVRLNPGTWRPVIRPRTDGKRTVTQNLGFAVVYRDRRRWHGELGWTDIPETATPDTGRGSPSSP